MASKKTPTKKPNKGMPKKKSSLWAKNKGDASSKAKKKMAWTHKALAKKAPGFAQVKLVGTDGKKHTYMTRTDTRGRTRIINNGQVEPKGYYGTGRGYFALKKNLRIHEDSPAKQKAFVAAHRAELMGAARNGMDIGGLDRMSRQGQIHTRDGVVYVNFRKDQAIRDRMKEKDAFFDPKLYPHAGSKRMSQSIIAFGQDGRVR